MSIPLRPLEEQVIVITGASSGIGLETALQAAQKGARVVLVARSADTLNKVAKGIAESGGKAIAVVADVSRREDMERAARTAIDAFGRIDTWVNNAGQGMYGRLDAVSDEDNRRLFDINFWGLIYGSQAALPYLKVQGGALINVGSEVSEETATPLVMYSATKHAVKAYTDGLRIELEELDKGNVAITLIQPTAVDTPFPQHARNYMEKEPHLPSPMIEPKQVAEAILQAATTHTRAIRVGMGAKVNTTVAKFLPGVAEKMAAKQADKQQYDQKPANPDGTLYRPGEAGHTHGHRPSPVGQ